MIYCHHLSLLYDGCWRMCGYFPLRMCLRFGALFTVYFTLQNHIHSFVPSTTVCYALRPIAPRMGWLRNCGTNFNILLSQRMHTNKRRVWCVGCIGHTVSHHHRTTIRRDKINFMFVDASMRLDVLPPHQEHVNLSMNTVDTAHYMEFLCSVFVWTNRTSAALMARNAGAYMFLCHWNNVPKDAPASLMPHKYVNNSGLFFKDVTFLYLWRFFFPSYNLARVR